MRVQLHTLGCRLNEAETERWAEEFHRRGIRLAADHEPTDLVVVNTCAVTTEAARKSRNLLRRTHRRSPDAKLIVSGCYASLEADQLAAWRDIDLLVTNRDKDRLVEIVLARFPEPPRQLASTHDPAEPLFVRGRQRAFVKVQDGCRHRCTFCIVSRARGAERSRPLTDVIAEVRRLTDAGLQEVVLTGVHLGAYGRDQGIGLTDLVRALLAETALPRLRLGALEPWDLPADLWDLFADPRLMPHLHLPIQSGSDRILRRMARRGTTDAFARLVAAGRAAVPDLNISTDIIAGFPGETDADWDETLAFVAATGFGQLHVFAYSPRPGTLAATYPDQIPAPVRDHRRAQMTALGRTLRLATLRTFIGRRMPVLREGKQLEGTAFGYTPNYLPVRFAVDAMVTPDPNDRLWDLSLVGLDPATETLIGVPGAAHPPRGRDPVSEVGPGQDSSVTQTGQWSDGLSMPRIS
ncbi:tRNA (N(6)-L-threonylcarbamoyladenosine(37)-C(2))-methylthiotransferase MtaB [Thioalkalicoccus limnaeus]|uniref:tRNA (N(6)-L-threonylcarbamoyladenosine(37)-C(2))-methylthiotransferase MtaB n=1 Tax=Thioalkalicoccus limnaeus TaxID=120681 RepID=A0ABV4BCM0_9GAMM